MLLCLLFSGAVSLLLMLLQANFACWYINKKLHLIDICTKFAKIYSDFDKLSSFSSVWPSGLRVCLTSTTIPIKFSLTKQNPYHNAASGLGPDLFVGVGSNPTADISFFAFGLLVCLFFFFSLFCFFSWSRRCFFLFRSCFFFPSSPVSFFFPLVLRFVVCRLLVLLLLSSGSCFFPLLLPVSFLSLCLFLLCLFFFCVAVFCLFCFCLSCFLFSSTPFVLALLRCLPPSSSWLLLPLSLSLSFFLPPSSVCFASCFVGCSVLLPLLLLLWLVFASCFVSFLPCLFSRFAFACCLSCSLLRLCLVVRLCLSSPGLFAGFFSLAPPLLFASKLTRTFNSFKGFLASLEPYIEHYIMTKLVTERPLSAALQVLDTFSSSRIYVPFQLFKFIIPIC